MVRAAIRRYMASRAAIGLKPATISDYESQFRIHILPTFADMALDAIRPEDIESFIATKREAGCATNSVLAYVNLLGAVINYEIKRGRCGSNPVPMADTPRAERALEIRYLNQQELDQLVAAVPRGVFGQLDRVLYLTAAMTGLRRGELLALRWQDVDTEAGVIRVRRSYRRGQFGTPKTRRSSRAVPLADRLRSELDRHRRISPHTDSEDLVFAHPKSGRVLDPSAVRKRFQATRSSAGLRPMRFHDLRHTFGTRMAAAGAPLRAIQEWLGHSDYQTTAIYADYAPDLTQANMWAAQAFGTSRSTSPH
jgi:integrase